MGARADREAQAARFAAELGLVPAELAAAAEAIWSNLNPQATRYETALSAAAAALEAVAKVRETVVNYVIEARQFGKPWVTMWSAHEAELAQAGGRDFAVGQFGTFAAGPASIERGGRLHFRLVRRSAAITDEVLETTITPEPSA